MRRSAQACASRRVAGVLRHSITPATAHAFTCHCPKREAHPRADNSKRKCSHTVLFLMSGYGTGNCDAWRLEHNQLLLWLSATSNAS